MRGCSELELVLILTVLRCDMDRRVLNKKGFTRTDLAMNGQQAVDMVEAKGKDHYGLILMDCEMVRLAGSCLS